MLTKRKIWTTLILAAMIVYVYYLYQKYSMRYGRNVLKKEKKFPGKTYITFDLSTSLTECGGLGNMLFRVASLYAIALYVNRTMYFEPIGCLMDYKKEFAVIFENKMLQNIEIRATPQNAELIDFALPCCKYEDPRSLLNVYGKHLKIHGNYLQSYKFFAPVQSDIRKMFHFSANVRNDVQKIAGRFVNNTNSIDDGNMQQNYLFCVHTRRGEFMESEHYSNKQFTERAIHYVYRLLKRKFDHLSLLLLGDDKNFSNFLNLNHKMIKRHQIFEADNRDQEFGFAVTHCNSLLLTSGPSTYAWWIAYLMPADSIIFYHNCPKCTHITKRDYYPNSWIALKWDEKRNKVEME